MKLIRKNKVSKKSIKWIQESRDRTDQERAQSAGEKVRRQFDCCELLRSEARWWTAAEIDARLHVGQRLVRRTLDHLEAAALIELERGGHTQGTFGGIPTRARFHLTKLQPRSNKK